MYVERYVKKTTRGVVQLLLKEEGVDISCEDNYGETTLDWAVKCRRVAVKGLITPIGASKS